MVFSLMAQDEDCSDMANQSNGYKAVADDNGRATSLGGLPVKIFFE